MQQASLDLSPRARLVCSYGDLEVIRWSEPTVEMNLAVDEQLAQCAGRTGRRVLRMWWGSNPTAVLGCGDKPEVVLNIDGCEQLGIGWVRRISGGGTVLQTPGVFNYSYTAPDHGRMDVRRTFERGAELIVGALAQFGVCAQQRGISDVAVGDLKLSGSAQARKWHSVLLHGTVLVDIDYDVFEAVLRHPPREPCYRRGRLHRDFLTSLRDQGVRASFVDLEQAVADAAKRLALEVDGG
jgi:lipoate-protein ligase A